MDNYDDITGGILAGGRGSRLGGQDKGLIEYQGKALFQHQIEALRPNVKSIVINANRNVNQYEKSGVSVISDQIEDFQGPLAGILSLLYWMKTEWLITVPCDGPFIANDYVSKMVETAKKAQVYAVVASNGQRQQPVYLLLHRSVLPSLEEYMVSGQRKIDRWYQSIGVGEAIFAESEPMFTNVNTVEELNALAAD